MWLRHSEYDKFIDNLVVLSFRECLARISRKFEYNEKFSFIRFEDIELRLMDNLGGKPVNHRESSELRADVKRAFQLKDKNWLIATFGGLIKEEDDTLIEYPEDEKMRAPIFGYQNRTLKQNLDIIYKYATRQVYYNPPLFYYFATYHPHILNNFMEKYIRSRRVIFVGGKHLRHKNVANFFNVKKFIQIPLQNAYYAMDKFFPQILDNLSSHDIILVSMGNGKVGLQLKLWEEYNYPTIDIGSLPSALIGQINRGWISATKPQIKNLLNIFYSNNRKLL